MRRRLNRAYIARYVPAAAVALLATALLAAVSSTLTLAGATLGAPVTSLVAAFGAPGLVETTDQGHEWRWFDANGIDVDLLTDDSLTIRQILVARPQALGGKTSPLVQPNTFPYLEAPTHTADEAMRRSAALHIAQPNGEVSVWRLPEAFIVFELRNGTVHKILALDPDAAARAGFVGSSLPFGAFRAPRLLRQYAVDYPKRAIDEHASGVVVVQAEVSAAGAVTSAKVIVSSGNSDIDNAELTSIRKSTFHAAQCAGQPCAGVYLDREEYTLGL
jgi:TonB family protein